MNLSKYKPKVGHVLVLKSLPANMLVEKYNFQWPKKGHVIAPDWMPTKKCGHGLHGWLWGQGDAGLRCTDEDAKWVVCSVKEDTIIDLDKKVKFPTCQVLFVGSREDAVAIIQHHAPVGTPVIFGTATAGNGGTATAGDGGTATAGDFGTATAGDSGTATAAYRGTATAGDRGTATAGYRGTATAGDRGTATAGDFGTATAGDSGTATAGDFGTATAGDSGTATAAYRGTATAGDRGTATAGYRGTATAGDRGTATAGDDGILIILFYDAQKNKYVKKIAMVDGVNYLPGQKYKLDGDGNFVLALD